MKRKKIKRVDKLRSGQGKPVKFGEAKRIAARQAAFKSAQEQAQALGYEK